MRSSASLTDQQITLAHSQAYVHPCSAGGGKSLCYQLPAVFLPGVAFVVSPLIALIQDQVESLQARGIKCAALNSAISKSQLAAVLRDLERDEPELKMVYTTPESLLHPGKNTAPNPPPPPSRCNCLTVLCHKGPLCHNFSLDCCYKT